MVITKLFIGGMHMAALKRYTPEDDKMILEKWWNPNLRDELQEKLGRTKGSLNFRYYQLLKKLGIDSKKHRERQGVIPDGYRPQIDEEDSEFVLTDKLSELEEDIINIQEVTNINRDNIKKTAELTISNTETIMKLQENINHLMKKMLPDQTVIEDNKVMDLDSENAELKKKLHDLMNDHLLQVKKNKRLYSELNYWVGQFLQLNNLERLSNLNSFLSRLKTVVEKYKPVEITIEDPKEFNQVPKKPTLRDVQEFLKI